MSSRISPQNRLDPNAAEVAAIPDSPQSKVIQNTSKDIGGEPEHSRSESPELTSSAMPRTQPTTSTAKLVPLDYHQRPHQMGRVQDTVQDTPHKSSTRLTPEIRLHEKPSEQDSLSHPDSEFTPGSPLLNCPGTLRRPDKNLLRTSLKRCHIDASGARREGLDTFDPIETTSEESSQDVWAMGSSKRQKRQTALPRATTVAKTAANRPVPSGRHFLNIDASQTPPEPSNIHSADPGLPATIWSDQSRLEAKNSSQRIDSHGKPHLVSHLETATDMRGERLYRDELSDAKATGNSKQTANGMTVEHDVNTQKALTDSSGEKRSLAEHDKTNEQQASEKGTEKKSTQDDMTVEEKLAWGRKMEEGRRTMTAARSKQLEASVGRKGEEEKQRKNEEQEARKLAKEQKAEEAKLARKEKIRLKKLNKEAERFESQWELEKERLEKERSEKERLKNERLEKERLEKERLEKEQKATEEAAHNARQIEAHRCTDQRAEERELVGGPKKTDSDSKVREHCEKRPRTNYRPKISDEKESTIVDLEALKAAGLYSM